MVKSKFKFAHIADCHIGGWRDSKMGSLSQHSFTMAIDDCISYGVDFIIIAGDLFNNAVPSIDVLKVVISNLKKLKDLDINVYSVAGSHDFSSSGKSILEVLEKAGFIINLVQGSIVDDKLKLNFTLDKKTGVKLTGMIGKKGTLEKKYYEQLDYTIEQEDGFKIFVFHSALDELMPKELKNMASMELKSLPNNFNYYAAGHVHKVIEKEINNSYVVYPGPTFPNNFKELEELHNGTFYIVDVELNEDTNGYNIKPQKIDISLCEHSAISIDCNNKNPLQINDELISYINDHDFSNHVVTLRMFGRIKDGKISEINFDEIISLLFDKGAYNVLKSTNKLEHHSITSKVELVDSSVSVEDQIISSIDSNDKKNLVNDLISLLGQEPLDEEKKLLYDDRIMQGITLLFAKIFE